VREKWTWRQTWMICDKVQSIESIMVIKISVGIIDRKIFSLDNAYFEKYFLKRLRFSSGLDRMKMIQRDRDWEVIFLTDEVV
jgi:hypothetical protein